MAIPMERSRGGLGALSATTGSSTTGNEEQPLAWDNSNESLASSVPIKNPTLVDEDLHALPPDLPPVYRPLDRFAQVLVAGIIGNLALIWDGTRKSQKIRNAFHLMFSRGPVYAWTEIMLQFQRTSWSTTWHWIRWLVGFSIKCTILSSLTIMVLQDIFLRPARISSGDLKDKYFLPSTLSHFEQVAVQKQTESASVGLHWLEYRNEENHDVVEGKRRMLYCNHGFGASSLSWLPSLKKMTQRLKCHVGLAHDALGFGFTELNVVDASEEDPIYWYSSVGSAHLANTLLKKKSLGQNDSVVLVGHSMGALTTLRLALELPKETEKRIILVSPALGIRQPPGARKSPGRRGGAAPKALKFARSWLLERPFQYVLRRTVGRPGFWRKGLQLVWGDANRLNDSDVLRFQWPAIHRGWEAGLVRFARAQARAFPSDDLGLMPDEELLIRALALPNTKVEVILAEKDRVVNPQRSRRFLEPFPIVKVQELAGLGHDPFEEDVDAFLHAIE